VLKVVHGGGGTQESSTNRKSVPVNGAQATTTTKEQTQTNQQDYQQVYGVEASLKFEIGQAGHSRACQPKYLNVWRSEIENRSLILWSYYHGVFVDIKPPNPPASQKMRGVL
jgi:hypothetical protein